VNVRTRLLLLLVAVVGLPAGVLLWLTLGELPERLVAISTGEMEAAARLVARDLPREAFSDSVADRLGAAAGVRVTLISEQGEVLGDSEIDAGRIPSVENHADRPEVSAALRGQPGSDTRSSGTVALSLLYVAVPHPEGGVVRMAQSLDEVRAPAVEARRALLATVAGALLLLLLARGLLERWLLAPVRRLRRDAEAMGDGQPVRRHRPRSDDEAGRLARALDALEDRLERERSESAEGRELARLLDRLDEGVAVVGAEGSVQRSNRMFREWTGIEAPRGRRLETLFRDPAVSKALEEGLAGRRSTLELELDDRTLLVTVTPDGDGAVVAFRDLTKVRKLEGVRRDFVANASHELKTPLTSVVGYAEPLTDPELPREQVVAFAEKILDNGTRMRRTIDDLLDLSRIEGGAWEPDPERVEVAKAAREAWVGLEPGGTRKGVELEIATDAAPAVRADPEAVHLVLRNLLDNATRYAPDGSAVRVRSRPEGDRVRIDVSDRGPGLPEVERERIFERFYRVDPGRSRAAGGTGLGLSIVKHLVAAHGGEVGVESRLGEGTTVWFELPGPPVEP
jgi:two-component system phosphate regulon sensor histidine kinase PhoR